MSALTQSDVLGHLHEHGPRTIRELVEAFADLSDDRRALEAQVHTYLIRLKRAKLIAMTREPTGNGRIWSTIKRDDDA